MAHHPRKRFSQNFLTDQGAIDDIVRAIGPRAGDNMIEIGPGLAALTQPLVGVVKPLHVVEIDRDIVARLRSDFAPDALVIHEGDVLELDFSALGPQLRVVGNLPYHISTPILFHVAGSAHALRDIHVMLQAEVVERIVARPGASDYGRLSVMLQYRFDIEKVLDVPAAAFRPAPKVESAVIRMLPRTTGQWALDETLLGQTVAAAFSQRRKTLRNTLGAIVPADALWNLGIDPQARAQTLGVEDFVKIANYRAQRSV